MLLAFFLLALLGIAVLAGFLGSLVGLGGGVVIGPALIILLQVPVVNAIGASAISVLGTSIAVGTYHSFDRLTNLRIGLLLGTVTVPGAMIGVGLTVYVARLGLSEVLLFVLGIVLLAMVPRGLTRLGVELPEPVSPDAISRRFQLSGSYHDVVLDQEVQYQAGRTAPALGVVFGAGVLSGLLGIGSGVLNVLALERPMRLPMKVASATSNYMIGMTIAASTGVLLVAGYVNPVLAICVALGTMAGALMGGHLLPRLSNRTVRLIFVPLLLVLGIELLLRGLGYA